jgi:hypothetical protein
MAFQPGNQIRKGAKLTEETREKIRKAIQGQKRHPETIARMARSYIGTTPDGEEIPFTNAKQFAKDNGLYASGITSCCTGVLKTHHGWKFRYAD